MPIIDVEIVGAAGASLTAQALADALGAALASPPGRTWVRLRTLDPACYAENGAPVAAGELPVFVTVLHARPPAGLALAAEVVAITSAVARCAGRPPERVHVQYAPAGAGRQAFGGQVIP